MNLSSLPPYQGKRVLIKDNHDVFNIVEEVCAAHREFANDYDLICQQFDAKALKQIFQKIFDFCKSKMDYRAESASYQTTRSPSAIMGTAKTIGVDCKHFSGWIAGVLDGLNRAGKNISWCYRFVSYDREEKIPSHVFIVAKDEYGNEIYIDPVLPYFNCRYPNYFYSLDKKCNMLERISGIGLTFNRDALSNRDFINTPGLVPLSNTPLTKFEPIASSNKKWLLLAGGALLLVFIMSKNKKRGK